MTSLLRCFAVQESHQSASSSGEYANVVGGIKLIDSSIRKSSSGNCSSLCDIHHQNEESHANQPEFKPLRLLRQKQSESALEF